MNNARNTLLGLEDDYRFFSLFSCSHSDPWSRGVPLSPAFPGTGYSLGTVLLQGSVSGQTARVAVGKLYFGPFGKMTMMTELISSLK